jgi:uncharacterized protein (DUF433 family)
MAGILMKNVESWGLEIAVAAVQPIDWPGCPLVEVNPNILGWDPIRRSTRMPASAIVDNFDYGLSVAEISEPFELPQDPIRAILTHATSHRVAHPV